MTYSVAPNMTYATLRRLIPPGVTLDANTELKLRFILTEGDGIYGEDVEGTFNRYDVEYEVNALGDPVDIIDMELADGTDNVVYVDETFEATGGDGDYAWTVVAGALPTGMTLNEETGVLSGTPTDDGDFTIAVQCADGQDPPVTDIKVFSFTIASAG